MKHTTRIRYVPSRCRSDAHKCVVCGAAGPHKYYDNDMNGHICKNCVNDVVNAEKAMNAGGSK
jgi:hypothetical protein